MFKSLVMILTSVLIAVGGQLCLKAGMTQAGRLSAASLSNPMETFFKVAGVPLVWIGLFLYGLSAIVWLVVLSRVDLSFAYPMVGFSYVVVLFLSAFMLGEQVSLLRWIGAVIICIGIALIART